MKLPDETVMAYVDDELDAESRARVEAAVAADPEIRAQLKTQIDLRARLRASFDPVLSEPVPERLLQTLGQKSTVPPAGITDLATLRATKQERLQARRRWSLPQFAALAASLIIGVLIGQRTLNSARQNVLESREGQLVASALLDEALTRQLASNQPDAAPVHIGLTYRDGSGAFCRTFTLIQDSAAGIACRSGDAWRVEMLTRATPADSGAYRAAASELPEAVRRAVETSISGEPLDAEAERAAQSSRWR